jgi:hypothetical protein
VLPTRIEKIWVNLLMRSFLGQNQRPEKETEFVDFMGKALEGEGLGGGDAAQLLGDRLLDTVEICGTSLFRNHRMR